METLSSGSDTVACFLGLRIADCDTEPRRLQGSEVLISLSQLIDSSRLV